jgi:hypothetical protein
MLCACVWRQPESLQAKYRHRPRPVQAVLSRPLQSLSALLHDDNALPGMLASFVFNIAVT